MLLQERKVDVLERETPCLSLLDAGQCMLLVSQVTIFMNELLILWDSENNLEFAVLGEHMSLLVDVNTDLMNVSFLFCFT